MNNLKKRIASLRASISEEAGSSTMDLIDKLIEAELLQNTEELFHNTHEHDEPYYKYGARCSCGEILP